MSSTGLAISNSNNNTHSLIYKLHNKIRNPSFSATSSPVSIFTNEIVFRKNRDTRIPPFLENRSTKVERLKHNIPPTSENSSCIQILSSLTISAIPNHHPSTSKCLSQAELEEESNTILSSSYSNFGNHCLNYEFNKQLSKILSTTTHSPI